LAMAAHDMSPVEDVWKISRFDLRDGLPHSRTELRNSSC
jgi:hypothetical protein